MSKITVRNKIGFHGAPAGNHTGIGDYYRRLDEVGVPFVIKSVDHYGHVHEALQYNNANHVYVFRLSSYGQPGNYNFDVPDYDLDPDEAAMKHMKHTKERLPPEYWQNRDRVWIEPINEVDRNRADWLGHFACEFADLAEQEGIKTLQYGWCAGEPEPDQWETEGQLRYLKLCSEKRDQFGIALHEYSYDKNDIWRLKGDLVGRFTHLFDVCDKHGLKRPQTVMTEWGWTHRTVPGIRNALKDIEEVNELYAKYPSIIGAAIWYLGSEYGSIHNMTQRLIKPVTDFSIKWKTEVEPNVPSTTTEELPEELLVTSASVTVTAPTPPSTLPTPPSSTAHAPASSQSARNSNAAYVADVSIPDDTEIPAGDAFTKTWRFRNTGETTWNGNYKLIYVHGEQMASVESVPVPQAKPGQVVQVSIPMTAPRGSTGTVFSDWRMVDDQGNQFGDVLYVRIAVLPPAPSGIDNLIFRADVTIPDDTEIKAGDSFTKTWKVRNTGNQSWERGYKLAHVGGAKMGPTAVDLPRAKAGETVEVSVPMVAPNAPGEYWSDWRPHDANGEFFGDIIYVRIVVPQATSSGRIQPISQNDPRWKTVRLGDSHSQQTVGKWGCLLTTLTMIANSYGKPMTPAQLNTRMLRKKLFLDHCVTPWNTLSQLYSDIIYSGRIETRLNANITQRIDASLKAGNPVAVQVDYTPNSPYSPNDQHWVLVVGREGQDYRINDPWLYPNEETSMRQRYGRQGKLLRHSIVSAVFYRSADPQPALPVIGGGVLSASGSGTGIAKKVLSTGININPDAPHSNPHNEKTFKGLDWVRFVYKVAAQPDASKRTLAAAYKRYDESIRDYHNMGVGTVLILNQETVWGDAPWMGKTDDWDGYATTMATTASRIARRYARYGDKIAYELWQNPNSPDNKAAIALSATQYALILGKTAAAIRKAAPKAKILFGGMAAGPDDNIKYVQAVQKANGGDLPVDALAIQPFGRWGTKAPFDWGKSYGTLGQAFSAYKKALPDTPLWITAMGVASDKPLGREHDEEIGNYWLDVCRTINDRHAEQVPVMLWFAWSDFTHNAGVIQITGKEKKALAQAFQKVASKSW